MNNVLLNESCAWIPQRSLDETLSVSCILPLEIYAHSKTVAIIKQLQFHMAGSFKIEEEKGGGKSSVDKKEICMPILIFLSSKCLVIQLGVHSTCLTTKKTSHFYFTGMKMKRKMDQLLSTCL